MKLSDHPLSPHFIDAVKAHPDLLDAAYEALGAERERLMRLADSRYSFRSPPAPGVKHERHPMLTVPEGGRLEAIVQCMNVHQGVNFLQGRGLEDFGFEGVDQVHGNSIQLACGCHLTHVFDHHRRDAADLVLHPHYPRQHCPKHASEDFRSAHAQALADNAG